MDISIYGIYTLIDSNMDESTLLSIPDCVRELDFSGVRESKQLNILLHKQCDSFLSKITKIILPADLIQDQDGVLIYLMFHHNGLYISLKLIDGTETSVLEWACQNNYYGLVEKLLKTNSRFGYIIPMEHVSISLSIVRSLSNDPLIKLFLYHFPSLKYNE